MLPMPLKSSLCRTCIHALNCSNFQKSQISDRPVHFCENFDDTGPAQHTETLNPGSRQQVLKPFKPESIEEIPGRMQGLCLNCENRASCRLPVQEGGVWYCEEHSS